VDAKETEDSDVMQHADENNNNVKEYDVTMYSNLNFKEIYCNPI